MALLALVALTATAACAGKQKTEEKSDLTDRRRGPPEFFENIPADTPYVIAGVEPMPLGAFSSYLTGYSEFLEQLDETMSQVSGPQMPPEHTFVMDVSRRIIEGWESEEGPTSVGFKDNAYLAIYGVGPFPVYRLELSSPQKLEQVLAEAEAKSGFGGDMRKLGEQDYRFYELEDDFFVAVAFTDAEMIVGGAHPDAFDEFLAYMLGQKKPEDSLADTMKIQNVIGKYGFEAFGGGYVDTKMIAAVMTGEQAPSGVMKEMLDAMAYEPPGMETGCRSDLLGFVDRHPRMVFGYTGFTPSEMSFLMGLESTTDLPERLAQTKTAIPNYAPGADGALAAMGAGVDIGQLLDVIAAEAKDIADNPYSCSEMADINSTAKQASMYMGQVPPFIRDMTGLRVELRGIEYDAKTMKLERLEAIAMIETRNPSTLLAQLQMFVPEFGNVAVKPDGVPVALQPFQGREFIKVPHVAMTENTLAVSIGVGMQDEMAVLLENRAAQEAGPGTPVFVFGYDYGRLFDEYDRILSNAPGAPGSMGFGNLASMFGFAEFSFDVNANGYFMGMDLEMKPEESASKESAESTP